MPGGEALARQFVHGQRFFRDEFGRRVRRRCGCPTRSATPPRCRRSPSRPGGRWFLTQKISLERDQPLPAPHLRLGGHRRHPDLHALPARRHLQLRAVRRRAGPCAAAVRREGAGQHVAGAVRLGRRRRRPDPGDAGRRAPHPRPGGLADRARSARPTEFFAAARGGVPGPAGVGGRAVPGVPPRHLHLAGAHQARQPAQRAPAARGRAVGHHRGRPAGAEYPVRRRCDRLLGDRAAAAVPRHPARHVDRLGAPAGRARVRPRRRRAGRRRSSDALTLLVGPGDRELAANAGPYAVDGVPGAGRGRPRGSGAGRTTTAAGRRRRARADHVDLRQGGRARARAAGPRGEPPAAAPRHPDLLGRLGHRPALPPHATTWSTLGRGRRDDGTRIVRQLRRRPRSRRRSGCAAAPSRSTPTSTGTSGRSCSSSRSRSTCTPTGPRRRSSSGTCTGRRTPTRPGTRPGSRRARTGGCTSASRATAWRWPTTRTYGHDITRDGADHDRAAVAAARPALPRSGRRPGRTPVPGGVAGRRDDRRRRRARATGSTCRCAGCAAATTSRRSWWWTTRPWSSRR